jgi:hypothetical protein
LLASLLWFLALRALRPPRRGPPPRRRDYSSLSRAAAAAGDTSGGGAPTRGASEHRPLLGRGPGRRRRGADGADGDSGDDDDGQRGARRLSPRSAVGSSVAGSAAASHLHRWRDAALLVACFGGLMPLVVFCVLTLPDEFTELTHWAVRHYEHASYDQSHGRVWDFAVSRALTLKVS